ncbi:MAG: lipopolysaccharide heptosyltransferase family protein [Rhodocyclaceae bacterium]|nr:MAG: lipopolysaccharide heptosyltransferase family protein [Rhodocyclaceae bacterium]
MPPSHPKLLLIKRDKIGDMVLTTPLLRLLKEALPNCELHVLANDYNDWVLSANPHVDHCWVFPRIRHNGKLRLGSVWRYLKILLTLRRKNFDVVLVGNGSESHRAISLGLGLKGKRTIAYCKKTVKGLSDPLPEPTEGHESRRLLNLASALGINVGQAGVQPEFHPQASALHGAETWLKRNDLMPGAYLLLGLGARRQHRQPTAAQVLRWSQLCHDRFGLKTALVWSPGTRDNPLYPGDNELAAEILARQSPHILPCQDGLQTVVGLAWLARCNVFPDSGLMHIASACPGGVVGLFADTAHSSSPDMWGPIGDRQVTLVADKAVAEMADEEIIGAVARLIANTVPGVA